MFLLIGDSTDPVLGHFARYINQRNQINQFIFIDQHKIGIDIKLSTTHWHLPRKDIPHHHIRGVFNRLLSMPCDKQQQKIYIKLIDLLNNDYPHVINRPQQTMCNSSKMLQLALLPKNTALKKPNSLLCVNYRVQTNRKKRYIYKSASAVRSIVSAWDIKANKPVHEPILIQSYIPGLNIRVHVIDKKVFPIAIESTAIDYRYGKKKHFAICKLPKKIRHACIDFSQACHLRFSGIDLIKQDKHYFALEANPSPGYSYYEQHMQKPKISHALLNALMQAP